MIPPILLKEAEAAAEKHCKGKPFSYKEMRGFHSGVRWLFQRLCEMSEGSFDRKPVMDFMSSYIEKNLDSEMRPTWNHIIEFAARHQHTLDQAALLKAREEIAERSETAKRLERLLFEEKVNLQKERAKCQRMERALKEIANHSSRETNGKLEYDGDTYGYILKVARQVLSGEAE